MILTLDLLVNYGQVKEEVSQHYMHIVHLRLIFHD